MAKTDGFCNRAEAYEAHDNVPLSPARGDTIGDLILRRYSRRAVLRGTLGAAASAALFGPSLLASSTARAELWISTDQGEAWPTGRADGLYGLETEGARRRTGKLFFRCPVGAELCGPCFTPDQETLFVAVQHPAADATDRYKGFERASTFADPATRWPDFGTDMPPRPSVLVITKVGGGRIA